MTTRTRSSQDTREGLAETGVPGLDEILGGGLARGLYLIEGFPGSGKTTLAFQFLLEGARAGESALYVTLSESVAEVESVALSHGWALETVAIASLAPDDQRLEPDQKYTMFHPSEVELTEVTRSIREHFERVRPTRAVLDSLSELRLMAGSPLRYRSEVLELKRLATSHGCTLLLTEDRPELDRDSQVRSLAHGIVQLEQIHPEYGAQRRRLTVVKYRGTKYLGGHHDYVIRRGGIVAFPRIVAADKRQMSSREKLSSGVAELDLLLGGGIERGTSTLIAGAPGCGKSTLSARFVQSAADRGQRAAVFMFDENLGTYLLRARGLGMDLARHVEAGRVSLRQVDPAELSPGEFAHEVCRAAERDELSVVVIDSLNGYLQAMPEERFLTLQLHEILTFLGQLGVATILIGVHAGLVDSVMVSPADASYLADSVILLRYFESDGEVRQAISVVKKRAGTHERTIREFKMEHGGIRVGEPLRQFQGILTDGPTYRGSGKQLLDKGS